MPPDHNVQREIELLEQRFAENSQGLVFAHLADAYRRAGEFGKAEGLILHGLKNHPNYTSAYNVLGRVYLDSQRYEEAQQQFARVLDLDPHNLAALRALADLAERDGRFDDARAWYERMLQIDPRSEEAKAGLAALQPEVEGHPEAPVAGAADLDVPEPAMPTEPPGDFVFAPEPESFVTEVESGGTETDEGAPDAGDAAVGWTFDQDLDAEIDSAFASAGGATEEAETEAEIGWPPTEPQAEAGPISEAAGAESMEIDFGIMDDWTPALLDGDEAQPTEDQPKAEEAEAGTGGFFDELDDGFTLDFGAQAEDEGFEPEAAEPPGEPLVTETMAKLYADQGLHEDALRVYRQLADARPEDESLAARIHELEERLAEPAADREGEAEEISELLKLTEAGSPVGDLDSSSASFTDVQAGDGDGFRFEDEAPHAGLEHLDPFAGSFDVFALKEPPAEPLVEEPPAEEPAVEEPIEEYLEATGEEITPEPVPEPAALETAPEPAVVWEEEISADEFEDVIPVAVEPEPFAAAASDEDEPEAEVPTPETQDATIEEYLASLLEFESPPETPSAEAEPRETAGESEGTGSDDLEKFQEWLRSLKR